MNVLEVTVKTAPLLLSETAKRSIHSFDTYDWVLFTSKNAVAYFMKTLGKDSVSKEHTCRVAAVGKETADALRKFGFNVTAIPEKSTVEDMLTKLGTVKGLRILFPRSALAPQHSIGTLRRKRATVRVIPLYTTVPVPLSTKVKDAIRAGEFSAWSFSSPSGIHSFLVQFTPMERKLLLTIPALCIGPTTLAAARAVGFSSARTIHS